jgi:hypothetical protein
MTHLRVQSRNDSEHEGTPQTDSLHDSSVNHTLIAIAQEVAELLKTCLSSDTDYLESTTRNHSSQSPLM